MNVIGYARVSTGEQSAASQIEMLQSAGCRQIFEEVKSASSRNRPRLSEALRVMQNGDTLVVVRIDRLARSLSDLLSIINEIEAKNCYFRSIEDPFDTSSPQGLLMIQLLGAFAEFERKLVRERTIAGMASAAARGRRPGNPKMVSGDKVARSDLSIGQRERYLAQLVDGSHRWLPTVERLRPHLSWAVTLRQVLAIERLDRTLSRRTLVKACKALVNAGYANPVILEKSPKLGPDQRVARIVADKVRQEPNLTLRQIATWLSHEVYEPTPRGSLSWSAEGVRRQIHQAKKLGLL